MRLCIHFIFSIIGYKVPVLGAKSYGTGYSAEEIVADSLVELSYYARLADVSVSGLRPLESQLIADYLQVPLEVEATGDYDALRKLFYYIDTSPSLLAITDLDLSSQAQGMLQARFKIANISQLQAPDSVPVLPAHQDRLQLVLSQWIGYAPLVIAKQKGYLDSDELRVDLLEIDNQVTIERLLVSGEIDAIGTSLPGLLDYWVQGIPLKIVLPINSTAGTEGIIVRSDASIKTLSELQQQVVAVAEGGILQFVLFKALEAAGMSLDDVRIQARDARQVVREIAGGTLDIGLTREPFLSELVASGRARQLYASDDLKGLIIDLLAVTPAAITDKATAIRSLIEAVLHGQQFLIEEPQQALEIVAEWTGQSLEQTSASLAKIEFYDAMKAHRFFENNQLVDQLGVFEAYFQATQQAFPLVTDQDLTENSFFVKVGTHRAQPGPEVGDDG